MAAAAPLASVSVHSDAITGEAQHGPRLPAFGRSFWRRQGAATPAAGTAMAANAVASIAGAGVAEEAAAPGSSSGAAELLSDQLLLASDASSAPRAAVAAQGTGGSPRGLTANNITAAPKIGITRGSQVARAVAPMQAARSSSANDNDGEAADASVANAAVAELALPAQAAALAPAVPSPSGSTASAPAALASSLGSVEEAERAEPAAAARRRWRRRWLMPRPPLQVRCPLLCSAGLCGCTHR